MTPKERAAMQQALEAMKDASPYGLTFKEAIIACEEALEHVTDGSPCWCNPELNYKDPETGAEVWVHKEPAELKECRHCGFLCKPNPDESRKWYPLEQPISQEPKSDCPCCGAKSSVLPMAFCRECKSEFWPPQPVRTKDYNPDVMFNDDGTFSLTLPDGDELRIIPPQQEQEPFDMNDHPPHRLCECRKCMEYFTPLPDCDAFATSGKPIAEQTNTQFMEGYRIGLAEMREKCATVVTEHAPTFSPHWVSYVAAIRAIKFEGDTGFRPVSEMIAEHKQDPKKAAAIEKAKMRKAARAVIAADREKNK